MEAPELASFVPTWLTSGLDPTDPARRSVSIPGALLFADISGFSTLANTLAERHGPHGAERLSAALNTFFAPLLAEVRSAGGEVASFAGDGLLACFPARGGDPADAAHAAAHAALAMIDAVAGIGAVDGVSLGLHAGVVAGDVVGHAVGGHRGRWLPVVLGPPVRQLRSIFPGTSRGQAVLSPEALAVLAGRVEHTPMDARRSLLRRVVRRSAPIRSGALHAQGAVVDLERWLPDAVRASADVPLEGWLAEIRTLTLLFLSLPDADADVMGNAQLSMAVRAVQQELEAHQGTLHQIAVDEKGVAVTCAFGLPGPGAERPPASAARCALALEGRLRDLQVRAGFGLATGRMFVGAVGDPSRRELALVGPAMIRAARMAGLAGGVVADDATRAAAEDDVELVPGAPLAMAGLAAVPTFRAVQPRRRSLARSRESLVGRQEVLGALDAALAAHARGEDVVLVLEGPAGIGKSRLAAHLAGRARDVAIPVLEVLGDLVATERPYHAWRAALERRLSIDEHAGAADRVRAAEDAVRLLPGAEGLAPLLAPALGVAMPDSPRTALLAAQGRADATADLLARLLATLLADGGSSTEGTASGVVIIADDAQWLDGASTLAIRALRRTARPSLVLVSIRVPDAAELPAEIAALRDEAGAHRIALGALDEDEVEQVVAERLGLRVAPRALAHWVAERAGGNPFFARELAASLASSGLVEIRDGELVREPGADELEAALPPASVEAVVTRRIDALPVPAQLALKAASVLGMRFERSALEALHPLGPEAVRDGLDALDAAGLCAPRDRDTWEIGHRIVLEVAYGLMAAELRFRQHASAATWLEENTPAESAQLAWHCERAGEPARALGWLEVAWSEADRAGALVESHLLARRAVALLPADADPAIPAAWWRRMSDASASLSLYTRGIDEARSALASLGRPLPAGRRAWRLRLLGSVSSQLGHALLPRAMWGKTDPGDTEAALALTRAAEGFYFVHGDHLVALTCFLDSANAAERAEIVGRVPNAYGVLGVALTAMGLPRVGRSYLDSGLAAATAGGDSRHVASSLFHLASAEATLGRWDAAEEVHERCAAHCASSGNRFLLNFVRSAQAMNALLCGRHRRAGIVADQLLDLSTQMRHERGEAVARQAMAAVALGRGDFESAATLSARARDALRARGDLTWATAAGIHARACVRLGATDEAIEEAAALCAALTGVRPADYRRLEGYAGPAEVLVAIPGQPAAKIDAALALLRAFSRTYRVGRARYDLLRGLALRARNERGAAVKALRAAAREAERRGLALELARARLALADLGEDRIHAEHARRWLHGEGISEATA